MSKSKLERTIRPRPGDLIEIFRGKYSHWAVYIGNGKIIHRGAEPGAGSKAAIYPYSPLSVSGVLSEKASVREDDLEAVAGESDVFISNKYDGVLPVLRPDEIVDRAMGRLREIGYNIFTNNCEHFAIEIRYGIALSSQVAFIHLFYEHPPQTEDISANLYRIQINPDVTRPDFGKSLCKEILFNQSKNNNDISDHCAVESYDGGMKYLRNDNDMDRVFLNSSNTHESGETTVICENWAIEDNNADGEYLGNGEYVNRTFSQIPLVTFASAASVCFIIIVLCTPLIIMFIPSMTHIPDSLDSQSNRDRQQLRDLYCTKFLEFLLKTLCQMKNFVSAVWEIIKMIVRKHGERVGTLGNGMQLTSNVKRLL